MDSLQQKTIRVHSSVNFSLYSGISKKQRLSEKIISMLKRDGTLLLEFSMNVDLYLGKVSEEMQYVTRSLYLFAGQQISVR